MSALAVLGGSVGCLQAIDIAHPRRLARRLLGGSAVAYKPLILLIPPTLGGSPRRPPIPPRALGRSLGVAPRAFPSLASSLEALAGRRRARVTFVALASVNVQAPLTRRVGAARAGAHADHRHGERVYHRHRALGRSANSRETADIAEQASRRRRIAQSCRRADVRGAWAHRPTGTLGPPECLGSWEDPPTSAGHARSRGLALIEKNFSRVKVKMKNEIATTAELADLLVVTEKTICEWARYDLMVKVAHGRYDFRESLRNYLEYKDHCARGGNLNTWWMAVLPLRQSDDAKARGMEVSSIAYTIAVERERAARLGMELEALLKVRLGDDWRLEHSRGLAECGE